MLKLTTYRYDQFSNLKAGLIRDGYTYMSALELDNTQKLISLRSEGPIVVDVSSLLPLLDPSGSYANITSIIETLIYQLSDDTLFIADESVATGREYGMRTLFDKIG